MKKCMHKIKNMPSQTSSIFPVLDRWANLLSLPVKSSVYFFSDSKPRACQKLRNGPGQLKICKCPTLGTDKAGKCPAVARGEGGGWGRWAQVELTDAYVLQNNDDDDDVDDDNRDDDDLSSILDGHSINY